MMKNRVYVVQLTMRWDRDQRAMVVARDVGDAERFGQVVHLLPPSGDSYPPDVAKTLAVLHEGLSGFTPDDYLVCGLGHPLALAWATAIASDRAQGKLRLLHWNRGGNCYVPVDANLFGESGSKARAA